MSRTRNWFRSQGFAIDWIVTVRVHHYSKKFKEIHLFHKTLDIYIFSDSADPFLFGNKHHSKQKSNSTRMMGQPTFSGDFDWNIRDFEEFVTAYLTVVYNMPSLIHISLDHNCNYKSIIIKS